MKINREVVRFIILRTIGNFLLFSSLLAIGMTLGPAAFLEAKFRVNQIRNVRYELAWKSLTVEENPEAQIVIPTPYISNATLFGKITGGDKVELITPVSTQFGIVIPKIGANAPIIPNVDAGRPDVYLKELKNGVAHAAGTVFPGVSGNIFLFAHSTDNFWNVGRYNAIFYLLKDLENNDEIDVFFNGKRHIYRVTNKVIVSPSEVEYLTQQTNFEQLTLQTCWPPGTTFKRLIVIARPESELNGNL